MNGLFGSPVLEVGIGRQPVPGVGQLHPALRPLRGQLQAGGKVGRQEQVQAVLAQRLVGRFVNSGDIDHDAYFA